MDIKTISCFFRAQSQTETIALSDFGVFLNGFEVDEPRQTVTILSIFYGAQNDEGLLGNPVSDWHLRHPNRF